MKTISVIAITISFLCNCRGQEVAQSLDLLQNQLTSLAQALPVSTEQKQEVGETRNREELKKKIYELIDTYMAQKAAGTMPLYAMISNNKECLRGVIWGAVEEALNYFPDKKALQTFTAYYSGGLGAEYLILKGLELVGFDRIQIINIVDTMYPRGSYPPGRPNFLPQATPRLANSPVSNQTSTALDFFKQKFLAAQINVFYSIYEHTFTAFDDPYAPNKTRSDIIFMLNSQDIGGTALANLYKAERKKYSDSKKEFTDQRFDYISLANAKKNVLIVQAAFTGANCAVIAYRLPLPEGKIIGYMLNRYAQFSYILTDMDKEANKPAYKFKDPTDPDFLQQFGKGEDEKIRGILAKMSDDNPNKLLLTNYWNKIMQIFNAINQKLKEWPTKKNN